MLDVHHIMQPRCMLRCTLHISNRIIHHKQVLCIRCFARYPRHRSEALLCVKAASHKRCQRAKQALHLVLGTISMSMMIPARSATRKHGKHTWVCVSDGWHVKLVGMFRTMWRLGAISHCMQNRAAPKGLRLFPRSIKF